VRSSTAVSVSCPIENCKGLVRVGLVVATGSMKTKDSLFVDVTPTEFRTVGAHNHEECKGIL